MDAVTMQGPVVVLPAEDYAKLLERVTRLEKMVARLARLLEDADDIRAMREADVEYRTGDVAAFDDLLAEIDAEG
ncbi:MAG: hypothetical protein HGB05_02725 [Chloroflexi bacterium]|nr:hypothetical protein [Chloroflexota bacterium]